jgi:nicotinamide-nucleotide amidase
MSIAQDVFEELLKRAHLLATAESCTGGMVAASITDIAGSSAVFDRGFVTYSNTAKTEMLGVSKTLIEAHGAVSEAVVKAMAKGALTHSRATIAVAITGIAGPTGGTETKPVGLVHFCCATIKNAERHERKLFLGDRTTVRALACEHALRMIYQAVLLA